MKKLESSKENRFTGIFITLAFLVVSIAPVGWTADVVLEDGRTYKGSVVVREDMVTILTHPGLKNIRNLYQFPLTQVDSIEADADKPMVINQRTVVRAAAAEDSEPLFEFEKGLVIKRLAVQGDWVQVQAWNDETKGFVPASSLSSSVEFTPEEQAAAKNRLDLVDPPPPGPARPSEKKENSASEADVPEAADSAAADPED
jgi:hypothetical protein